MTAAQPRDDHRRRRAGAGRERRRHRDAGREVGEAAAQPERRTGVEAVPADPQDHDAEEAQRHRVTRQRVDGAVGAELAAARADHDRAHQRGPAAHRVDDGRAGEVDHAVVAEHDVPGVRAQEALAPRPVGDHRVDHRGDDHGVDQVRGELRPLRDRARDDGGRRGGERELEEEPGVVGVLASVEEAAAAEELDVDELGGAVREAPPDRPVGDGAEREVQRVLHQDVGDVLRADEP